MSVSINPKQLLQSEKLLSFQARLTELNKLLSDPSSSQDADTMRRIGKEHAETQQVVSTAQDLQKSLDQLEQTQSLFQDPDMLDLAKHEAEELQERVNILQSQL